MYIGMAVAQLELFKLEEVVQVASNGAAVAVRLATSAYSCGYHFTALVLTNGMTSPLVFCHGCRDTRREQGLC